jgi:hypothetical protein
VENGVNKIYMNMTITMDSLMSGLVGAAIGAFAAGGIAWWFALNTARDNLRTKLLSLKTFSLFEIKRDYERELKAEYSESFKKSYPDVLAATLAYRKLLPICMQFEIDEALFHYRFGPNKNPQILPQFKRMKYSHLDVISELDFQKRIDALLKAIDRED